MFSPVIVKFLNICDKTGNTGFEFLADSSTPIHYPALSVSKPWESYRLRVLPSPMVSSTAGGVTSLPYITTSTFASSEGMQLYPSSQAVSLPAGTGSSITELRGTSDPKVTSTTVLTVSLLLTLYPLRRTAIFPKSVNTDSLPMYNISFESY